MLQGRGASGGWRSSLNALEPSAELLFREAHALLNYWLFLKFLSNFPLIFLRQENLVFSAVSLLWISILPIRQQQRFASGCDSK